MISIHTSDHEAVIRDIRKKTSFIDRPESSTVRQIVKNVKDQGNKALINYLNEYETVTRSFEDIEVTPTEIDLAHGRIEMEMLEIIRKAAENIRLYHEQFVYKNWVKDAFRFSKLGMKVSPIDRVGVYVPGGTAAYPSTVLMNVIPAQVAGVKDIVLVSPSTKEGRVNDMVLAAAKELGISTVYRMGGAQAVAALAFGTESLKPVDMIVGPGNIYVTLAKKEVYGAVGVDKLAGPSDICVVADRLCNVQYVAADMLAQAEHDPLASAICITDSSDLAYNVKQQVEEMMASSPRRDILQKVLQENSAIFVVGEHDYAYMARLVNQIAPEHLEIFHEEYKKLLSDIRHAGAIFIGEYSAEVLGDYMMGPNHVLPTGGTARFSSPLSAVDFMKTSTLSIIDRRDFQELGPDTAKFADYEDLPAHANAIRVRL